MKRAAKAERDTDRVTHRSLERGLRILEAVAASGGPASLAETARRTGLHRSTTHHLMQALVSAGFLRHDPRSHNYALAAKLFRMTGRPWTFEQLGEIAQPFLAELTRRSGEGSSAAAYRDGVVHIIAKHDSEGPVRVTQNVGADRPIHATAVGKAIAAFLPPVEIESLIASLRLERFTPKTITTRSALEAELRRIRDAGCTFDDEEHVVGIRCIAAPVFSHSGHVVASLCALGPRAYMTRQKLRDLRAPLLELTGAMSERLGWRPETAGTDAA